LKLNEIIETQIEDFTSEGDGVARHEDFTLFISGALPAERVRARVVQLKKHYGRADLVELLKASPHRVKPACSETNCGGCNLAILDYQAQLQIKKNWVEQALKRIGGFSDVTVAPVLGMAEPKAYRNKALFHIAQTISGPRLGFYAGKSHQILPLEHCLLLPPEILQLAKGVEEILNAMPDHSAAHLLIRRSAATGEALVALVTPNPKLWRAEELAAQIHELPGVVSVAQSVNPAGTGLGSKTKILAGRARLREELNGLTFYLSPEAFFQVNTEQTQVLYRQIFNLAGLLGQETVWDLYCGVGSITLLLAQHARQVTGVEIVPAAVADAELNAEANGLSSRVRFIAGPAEQIIPGLAAAEGRPELVILDPPRAGAQPKVLKALAAAAPPRIIYVSCNPATLARDLKYLAANGYAIGPVQPVDMFPQTGHIECAVLMMRVEK